MNGDEALSTRRPRNCFARANAAVLAVGICAAFVFSIVLDAPVLGRTDDNTIATSLAAMLRASRTVISRNQDRINDPNVADKGLSGKVVLDQTIAIFRQNGGPDPASIDPNSLQGKLIRMQMDSIAEVMDVHQETINRQGVGFKGFIPAVFSRMVNEAFGRRAAGIAEMKVTAPPALLRNPHVKPDEWELDIIATKLQAASWPKDEAYTAMAPQNGKPAERTLFPEYYGPSCLTCHGSPKGEIDITGFPKEGASAGDLGGIISIALFR
jgi:hypothetical protein